MRPGPLELARGTRGERSMLELLCQWRDNDTGDFCRPDFLWVPRHDLWPPFIVEAKDQDHFVAPPFDGHGLSKRQYDVYMDAYRKIGLGTLLYVYDRKAGQRYWGFLSDLAAGPSHLTNGEKPRIVFPLDSFGFRGDL